MRFITLNDQNVVVSVRYGASVVDGEIQSDEGELGQILQPDGTFIKPDTDSQPVEPTTDDKINYLYYKSIGVIE